VNRRLIVFAALALVGCALPHAEVNPEGTLEVLSAASLAPGARLPADWILEDENGDSAPVQDRVQLRSDGRSAALTLRTGTERFMLDDRPKKIRLGPPLFVVADACTMVRNSAITGAPISQTEALLALREHLRTNPQDADRFTVIPKYAEAA